MNGVIKKKKNDKTLLVANHFELFVEKIKIVNHGHIGGFGS